jgi:outer membrane protein assembly factor BamA
MDSYSKSGFFIREVKHLRSIKDKNNSVSIIAVINDNSPKIFKSNDNFSNTSLRGLLQQTRSFIWKISTDKSNITFNNKLVESKTSLL